MLLLHLQLLTPRGVLGRCTRGARRVHRSNAAEASEARKVRAEARAGVWVM
jgi:hypothetical protein